MPTTSDELSLINGSEFLDELTQRLGEPTPDPSMPAPRREPAFADEFFGLDSGLPIGADAPLPADEDRAPLGHPYDAGPLPAYEERGIPLFAAAAVLIACLTVGVATAAVVFHDRLAALTSLASR